ncbi:MAG: alpha/beta hydrolase [Anaerolineales bacterium]|nr:alpha/beta hydrolase [Anaerolineales bacterium]
MSKVRIIIIGVAVLAIIIVGYNILKTEEKQMDNQLQTEFFTRPEGTIAYDDTHSEGELVILLPGMGALRSEYRYLAPALELAGYRVVTADLRGHGESSVDWDEYTVPASGKDILEFIEHLDAGPAHVIGTSFSPGAAVWAAAEQPEAIRSLTLIGAFVRTPEPTFMTKVMENVLMRGPWKVQVWGMLYKSLYPTNQPADFEAYINALKTSLREPGRFEALYGMAISPREASEERLDQVTAPALVVMGTKDPDWPDPIAEAEFIQEQLSAELVLIDGAGHYPQTEMPEKTAPAIIEFLNSLQ